MYRLLIVTACCLPLLSSAQNKKPLTHAVYDGWLSAGERQISNDGRYVLYAINPQEGDGRLIIKSLNGNWSASVPRGYKAVFTDDSRFAILSVKPAYQDMRQARIKKKKPDEMTKDSLAIVQLGTDSIRRIGRVKSYAIPERGAGWVAYMMEKPLPDTGKKKMTTDSLKTRIDMLAKMADSMIRRSLDSVKGRIEKKEVVAATQKAVKEIYKKADDLLNEYGIADAEGDDAASGSAPGGNDLLLHNLVNGKTITFKPVNEYLFDKKGKHLLIETAKNTKDSNSVPAVMLYELASGRTDTVMRKFNDARNFTFDEAGSQLAFVAERDSSPTALQKFYKLWYYTAGKDSAALLADMHTTGMQVGFTVSEDADLQFSKDARKLFFGASPVKPAADTSLVDFELARLDVWNYKDDYLQPQQLKQLSREQRRSYMSVVNIGTPGIVQLGSADAENVTIPDEGNADWVLVQSSKGALIPSQWEGRARSYAYVVHTNDGKRTLVSRDMYGSYQASPKGKYVYWYNPEAKHYYRFDVATGTTINMTGNIKEALYDLENDVPDFPSATGTIGWTDNDECFLLKDNFDIWKVDPAGIKMPVNLSNGFGKLHRTEFSFIQPDKERRTIDPHAPMLLATLDKTTKHGGFYTLKPDSAGNPVALVTGPYMYPDILKARNATVYLMQRTSIAASELYAGTTLSDMAVLTNIADQQKDYNWLTAELVRWKMFDGRMSEGILYKPENFDPKKKYPVIFYFYERNSDLLYSYKAPAPSASVINVPYFVSNGYMVFDPNIYYKTGEPGQSAYNSVVSAAKFLSRLPFIDSANMAIQGQSWGGYQVAYLVTRTNMFKAAGAGAPVANMTSAYGGIRWGSGLNRQFQYEKTQSRIGATLWERPDLYIKNSPLFFADKVNTPLLLMHNDADGSVPWYQGIEYFTALRRLGKKVWMLEYNGEDHNLVERKNRKDLSVRLAQFFGYYLKGARPARWMIEGLPAVDKGRDWGLETE